MKIFFIDNSPVNRSYKHVLVSKFLLPTVKMSTEENNTWTLTLSIYSADLLPWYLHHKEVQGSLMLDKAIQSKLPYFKEILV